RAGAAAWHALFGMSAHDERCRTQVPPARFEAPGSDLAPPAKPVVVRGEGGWRRSEGCGRRPGVGPLALPDDDGSPPAARRKTPDPGSGYHERARPTRHRDRQFEQPEYRDHVARR